MLGCAAAWLLAVPALAVPINHGTFTGNTVEFQNVTEDSATDTPPLFGSPEVAGDTLLFTPVGFDVFHSGAAGPPDETEGNLGFRIEALEGFFIDQVRFSEAGDYSLLGTGTTLTQVSVAAPVILNIVGVDGQSVNPINVNADIIRLTFNLQDHPGQAQPWSGSVQIDLTQALLDAQVEFVDGATAVTVNVDNSLLAQSEPNSSARMAKKDFQNRGFGVEVLPEPTAGALLLLGLAGLGVIRRS